MGPEICVFWRCEFRSYPKSISIRANYEPHVRPVTVGNIFQYTQKKGNLTFTMPANRAKLELHTFNIQDS